MSFENLFKIQPLGVVSKNKFIGAWIILYAIFLKKEFDILAQ